MWISRCIRNICVTTELTLTKHLGNKNTSKYWEYVYMCMYSKRTRMAKEIYFKIDNLDFEVLRTFETLNQWERGHRCRCYCHRCDRICICHSFQRLTLRFALQCLATGLRDKHANQGNNKKREEQKRGRINRGQEQTCEWTEDGKNKNNTKHMQRNSLISIWSWNYFQHIS